ncbi:C-type lectin domain family 4 member F-like [Cololabis saira]|uniref:C-type lectin domain family 4 member F-like n=1 Tax=Cololabis saira TaxID=129043 RepID=UPI002AD4BA9E|nr:C-type lectin domain family 4 member F-like [Cololabis saira]
MEDIYVNVENEKPIFSSTIHTGSNRSKRTITSGVIAGLVLSSFLLLVGLITLGVFYRDSKSDVSKLSNIKDLLNTNLTEMANERIKCSNRSKRTITSGVIAGLVLSSFLLLVGLITLGVFYRDSKSDVSKLSNIKDLLNTNLTEMANERIKYLNDFSKLKDNLTLRLQASKEKLSSLTEERDLLKSSLTEMTKELNKYTACPAGWRRFRCSCYLLSTDRRTWDEARQDCRVKGADLVVINDSEEQRFLSTFGHEESWIGLNDKGVEGTWKWLMGVLWF